MRGPQQSHALFALPHVSPSWSAEARLQQKADQGAQRAAELLAQWDEAENLARPDGEPWWTDCCPKCQRVHSWQASVQNRLLRGAAASRIELRLQPGLTFVGLQALTALSVLHMAGRRAPAAA